eukprot:333318-Rhodomonas_salina.1
MIPHAVTVRGTAVTTSSRSRSRSRSRSGARSHARVTCAPVFGEGQQGLLQRQRVARSLPKHARVSQQLF